jgi:hypothetical protein
MRLPSLTFVVSSSLRTAQRFPFVLGAGFVATFAGVVLSTAGTHAESQRLLFTAMLGLPLLFALSVLGERLPHVAPARWLLPAAGVGVLAAIWMRWGGWSSPIQTLRYAQLVVAFHLMVAFAPYVGSSRPNGFWQYNRILFLRFLTAWLYSVVLYAGLGIALLALNKLFGVSLAGEIYLRLWILIAFVFHTWFFLGGIPEDFGALDELSDYPAGLKVFTQYVLIPIVALYLTILTAYLAKVLYTGEWPKGWIGYLVSSVAAVGILSWLLVYPLEEQDEYAWVKTFTKGFYVVLMPAIVMLWFAVYKRVGEYGITEKRYLLFVLSIWLTAIALYYTFSRSRNIKLIPASLCAMALITFAGPTGAYSVSLASQTKRLQRILARNELLVNGQLHAAGGEVSLADRREIGGSLVYLLETHGYDAVAPWLTDSMKKNLRLTQSGASRYTAEADAKSVMASIGLEYVQPGVPPGPTNYFTYGLQNAGEAVSIDGYTYALRVPYWNGRDSLKVATGVWLSISTDSTALHLVQGGTVLLDIPFQGVVDAAGAWQRAHPNQSMPADVLRVEVKNGATAALVYITNLMGWKRPDGVRLVSFAGEIFLRLK